MTVASGMLAAIVTHESSDSMELAIDQPVQGAFQGSQRDPGYSDLTERNQRSKAS